MRPEVVFLAGVALPFFAGAVLLLDSLFKAVGQGYRRHTVRRNRRAMIASLPAIVRNAYSPREKTGWLGGWDRYAGQQIRRAGWSIRPALLVAVSACLALLAMVAAYALTRNVLTTLTVAIIFILLPFSMLNLATQKQEQNMLEQLPVAVQAFAVQFAITNNAREALARAMENVGAPLRGSIERCVRNLGAGKHPREAFIKLAEDLDSDYGRLWAQMLLAASEDMTVVKVMPRLINRLSEQRLLLQKNSTDLSGEKRVGVILNALILPGFMLTQILFPASIEFYSTTVGRLVIMCVFLSVVAYLTLDRVLRRVDL